MNTVTHLILSKIYNNVNNEEFIIFYYQCLEILKNNINNNNDEQIHDKKQNNVNSDDNKNIKIYNNFIQNSKCNWNRNYDNDSKLEESTILKPVAHPPKQKIKDATFTNSTHCATNNNFCDIPWLTINKN